jgi:hypothetical protein
MERVTVSIENGCQRTRQDANRLSAQAAGFSMQYGQWHSRKGAGTNGKPQNEKPIGASSAKTVSELAMT